MDCPYCREYLSEDPWCFVDVSAALILEVSASLVTVPTPSVGVSSLARVHGAFCGAAPRAAH